MEIRDIDPIYYARNTGTGVALARIEDRPPSGSHVDFMRGHGVIKLGAIVPMSWDQLWDYRNDDPEMPTLLKWPQFLEWLEAWPDDEAGFKAHWKRTFGMPGIDLADAMILVWENA